MKVPKVRKLGVVVCVPRSIPAESRIERPWHKDYADALLELDCDKLSDSISTAEEAIELRYIVLVERLMKESKNEEFAEMREAICALSLRKLQISRPTFIS